MKLLDLTKLNVLEANPTVAGLEIIHTNGSKTDVQRVGDKFLIAGNAVGDKGGYVIDKIPEENLQPAISEVYERVAVFQSAGTSPSVKEDAKLRKQLLDSQEEEPLPPISSRSKKKKS